MLLPGFFCRRRSIPRGYDSNPQVYHETAHDTAHCARCHWIGVFPSERRTRRSRSFMCGFLARFLRPRLRTRDFGLGVKAGECPFSLPFSFPPHALLCFPFSSPSSDGTAVARKAAEKGRSGRNWINFGEIADTKLDARQKGTFEVNC